MFAQHGSILIDVSPKRALIAGSVQPKTRVSIAKWNLNECYLLKGGMQKISTHSNR
ncbi:MAG: hypothetical protein LBV74_21925 [Tannerella sp.]|nr:hypothetical protein [Tannerella sp.]